VINTDKFQVVVQRLRRSSSHRSVENRLIILHLHNAV